MCTLARKDERTFSDDEKYFIALCLDIFVEDFKNKISVPEGCPFLPFVTGEKICHKTKLSEMFDTGTKFTPRQLAMVKACFDLKQNRCQISRINVARHLYLQDIKDDVA